jgi:hypothetical protein
MIDLNEFELDTCASSDTTHIVFKYGLTALCGYRLMESAAHAWQLKKLNPLDQVPAPYVKCKKCHSMAQSANNQ